MVVCFKFHDPLSLSPYAEGEGWEAGIYAVPEEEAELLKKK